MTISGGFISVIFMLILHFILPPDQIDKYWSIVLLITIYLILSPLETITTTYYTLKGNALPLVIRTFCSGILVAIVNIYTIKYLHMGYVGWLIGSAIASIFLLLSCIYPFWIKRKIFPSFKFNVRKHWKTLKVGFLVIPHNISMYIFNTSDRVLLNVFKVSTNSIGLYSQGYNIGSYGSYLITGVFSALTPQIQSAYREGRKKDLRFLFMGIQLLLSSILFVIALWIKEAFLLLFKTPELQNGNSVAVIILCAYKFLPMYAFVTIHLFIKKNTGLI
jgi:O-antigen/teichoic acid export membrane protein